jgi:hypothetical protein
VKQIRWHQILTGKSIRLDLASVALIRASLGGEVAVYTTAKGMQYCMAELVRGSESLHPGSKARRDSDDLALAVNHAPRFAAATVSGWNVAQAVYDFEIVPEQSESYLWIQQLDGIFDFPTQKSDTLMPKSPMKRSDCL